MYRHHRRLQFQIQEDADSLGQTELSLSRFVSVMSRRKNTTSGFANCVYGEHHLSSLLPIHPEKNLQNFYDELHGREIVVQEYHL